MLAKYLLYAFMNFSQLSNTFCMLRCSSHLANTFSVIPCSFQNCQIFVQVITEKLSCDLLSAKVPVGYSRVTWLLLQASWFLTELQTVGFFQMCICWHCLTAWQTGIYFTKYRMAVDLVHNHVAKLIDSDNVIHGTASSTTHVGAHLRWNGDKCREIHEQSISTIEKTDLSTLGDMHGFKFLYVHFIWCKFLLPYQALGHAISL